MTEAEARAELKALAPRELEVLVFAAKGFRAAEVAQLMGLSELTVKSYKKRITLRLDLNMYAACALAGRAGLT